MGGTDGFVGILGIALGLKHMELTVIIALTVAGTDEIRGSSHGFIGKP